MRRRPAPHRPTFGFTGLSHWCTCTCGWRSQLSTIRADVDTAFTEHSRRTR